MSNKDAILAAIADGGKTRTELLEAIPGLNGRGLAQSARALVNAGLVRWKHRKGVEILEKARRASPPPDEDPVATDDGPTPTSFAIWNDGGLFMQRDDEKFSLTPDDVQSLCQFLARTIGAAGVSAPPPLLTDRDGATITARRS